MRRLLSHLSYANVVATLALVLAVTGGAYAATQLPKNSVGSKQVTNGSLKAKDFKPGQLPAGATGPAGPRGPQGPQGAKGDAGAAGPSLLVAGRKNFQPQTLPQACNGALMTTNAFTVPETTYLWVDGTTEYSVSAADEGAYFPYVSVSLYRDDNEVFESTDQVVGSTPESVLTGENHARLDNSGWLMGGPDPATLQPGVHYRLALSFLVSGGPSCGFTAFLNNPTISWAGYPAPS